MNAETKLKVERVTIDLSEVNQVGVKFLEETMTQFPDWFYRIRVSKQEALPIVLTHSLFISQCQKLDLSELDGLEKVPIELCYWKSLNILHLPKNTLPSRYFKEELK